MGFRIPPAKPGYFGTCKRLLRAMAGDYARLALGHHPRDVQGLSSSSGGPGTAELPGIEHQVMAEHQNAAEKAKSVPPPRRPPPVDCG